MLIMFFLKLLFMSIILFCTCLHLKVYSLVLKHDESCYYNVKTSSTLEILCQKVTLSCEML